MLDMRPILLVLGLLLAPLGLAMTIPVAVDLWSNSPDWQVFFLSGAFTVFVGISLYLVSRGSNKDLNLKQAFVMTALIWVVLPAFAALPFYFSELSLSYSDSYFEAMSGLTTTGSTILTGLDALPPGILIWRAILQWLGGLGIIVMALVILPILGVGGMQLFRVESFETSGNIIPRARQLSVSMTRLYLILTMICAGLLMAAGLSPFDAFAHAMTTIATGGFSTSDISIGKFDSAGVESIIILFMIIGSLPFALYLQSIRGKPLALWRDSQVRTFIAATVVLVGMVVAWLISFKAFSLGEALRFGSFNVISIMTGTGYTSTDFGTWGAFAVVAFFMLMFIGGCAGSTSCGIKIFRFQVLFSTLYTQIRQINRPHGVFHPQYNNRPIPPSVTSSVMSFLFLFFVSFLVLAIALSATGLDYITALSGAATAIANVGPGLGDIIGPAGTFAPLSDPAKWLLSFGMVLGRLELFTILLLFSPAFWRG